MIVLVGFMGAGKTTVGRRLAAREGVPFVDSDEAVAARTGTTVPAYFRDHGEAAFRQVERDTILELLAGPPCVLALGGGSLGSPEVRAALADHQVVHLQVGLEEALARTGDPGERPMLARADVPDLYAARLPVYDETATVAVDTSGRSADDVAEAIVHALPRSSRPRVVLVGPPGAGKTAVGHLLAELLGTGCVETDREVERIAGRPVSEVFVEEGEAAFRELERQATLQALVTDGVVALGGGAVLDGGVREVLREHQVVFLDVGIADAAKRIGFDQPGMVALLPRRSWITHMQSRRPLYEQVATWTVDTAGRSTQDVADQVVELLQGGTA